MKAPANMLAPLPRTLFVLFFLSWLGTSGEGTWAFAQGLAGPVEFPGVREGTRRRLAAVDRSVADEQWGAAVEELLRILDEAGDDLVPLDAQHSLRARWLCHARLAALPAAGLRLYRERVDGQAHKWWEQASSERAVPLLRRLVEEAFCSRDGDRALDLLGDLAFEQGATTEAEYWWRMLALPADELVGRAERPAVGGQDPPALVPDPRSQTPVFPDPQVDVARVRAKQIIARLVRGDLQGIGSAVAAYQKLHGGAKGELAGKKGLYARLLQELASRPAGLRAARDELPWSTFSGSPSREWVPPRAPRQVLFEIAPWSVRIGEAPEADKPGRGGKPKTPSVAARALATYPVIAGQQVLVANASQVTAYDLMTGRLTGKFEISDDDPRNGEKETEGLAGGSNYGAYTLTVCDERVFARLGSQVMSTHVKGGESACEDSYIVCLDLRADTAGTLPLRWKVKAQERKTDQAMFEGTPIVQNGRVYVGRVAWVEGRAVTGIDCYSAATGARLWRQPVCEASRAATVRERFAPRNCPYLVTRAGPNVAYCSHSGGVIALDAITGRLSWVTRYPAREVQTSDDQAPLRSLAPCIYAAGRLYVAPVDYDRILCLDAVTGRTIWESQVVDVLHLLGVAKDRLIFTTATIPRGIRGLDAVTGRALREWVQPDDGQSDLPTFGRGFLAGDQVFWPTLYGLRVLRQEDGHPEQVESQPLGNLAYGNGCLAVADAQDLRVYARPARRLDQRRKEAAEQSETAAAWYSLALAEIDADRPDQASASLAKVQRLAGPKEQWRGRPLRELAGQRRHDVLLDHARETRAAGNWAQAAAMLEQAASPAFSISMRLRALNELADLWLAAKEYARGLAVWQNVLSDPVLRQGHYDGPDGVPRLAGEYASTQIKELMRLHPASAAQTQRSYSRLYGTRAEGPSGINDSTRTHDRAAVAQQPRLPLARAWQINLEEGERLLALEQSGAGPPIPAVVFFARDGQLTCRDAGTGEPIWVQSLASAPSWAGLVEDRIITAGPGGVQTLRLQGGTPVWALPARELRGNSTAFASEEFAASVPLSHFQVAGPRLFFLQGKRRVFAIEVATGRVLWTRWAPGAAVAPPAPGGTFHPIFLATRDWLAMHTLVGRCLICDSRTGQVAHASTRDGTPWTKPPIPLDDGRRCLVTNSRSVACLNLATAQREWISESFSPQITLLSPQLFQSGQRAFQIVDGWNLQELNLASGKVGDGFLLGTEPIILEHAAWDETAIYYVSRNILHARALTAGRRLWELALPQPAGRWRIIRLGRHLAAVPLSASPSPNESSAAGAPEVMSRAFSRRHVEISILICDSHDGKLIQRLSFRPRSAPWSYQRVASGIVVAAAGQAWGFTQASRPEKN
jgi:outer membrane protein assembly factor BamB